ncbi:MAG: ATP-dependent DNA helicase [Nanobdellota archaeon]
MTSIWDAKKKEYVPPSSVSNCNKISVKTPVLDPGSNLSYLYMNLSCKSLWCPKCRVYIKEQNKRKVINECSFYRAQFFLTLTNKSPDYKPLKEKFNQLVKGIKSFYNLLQRDRVRFNEFLYEEVEFLLGHVIKKQALIDLCKDLNKNIKKDNRWKKYLKSFISSGSYGIVFKYLSVEQKKELKSLFSQDLKEREQNIRESDSFKSTQVKKNTFSKKELIDIIERRFTQSIKTMQEKGLYYYGVPEFQKNGNLHYHIILNCYFPSFLVSKFLDPDTNGIFDNKDLEDRLDNIKANSGHYEYMKVAMYILKYMTKSSKHSEVLTDLDLCLKMFGKYPTLKSINKDNPFKRKSKFKAIGKNIYGPSLCRRFAVLDVEDSTIYKRQSDLTTKNILSNIDNKSPDFHSITLPLDIDTKECILRINEILKYRSRVKKSLGFFDLDHFKATFSSKDLKLCDDHISLLQAICSEKHRFILLNAPAGTGKTTLVNLLPKLYKHVSIKFVAYTGKSAQLLSSGGTIHHTFQSDHSQEFWLNEDNVMKDLDLLVIDEISMVPIKVLSKILEGLPNNCKILMCGDENQTKEYPIDTISFLKEHKRISKFKFSTRHRQKNDSLKSLVYNLEKGKCEYDKIIPLEDSDSDIQYYYNEGFRFLCNNLRGVRYINHLLCRYQKTPENFICFANGYHFCIGDPVVSDKNLNHYGIKNGQLFTIKDYKEKDLSLFLENKDGLFNVSVSDFFNNCFSLSYALTIKKFQGSGYSKVFVYICDYKSKKGNSRYVINRDLLNTGITRAKEEVKVYFESQETYDLSLKKYFDIEAKTLLDSTNLSITSFPGNNQFFVDKVEYESYMDSITEKI